MESVLTNVQSLAYFVPEIVLTSTVMLILILDILGGEHKKIDFTGIVALLGSVIAFVVHFSLYYKAPTLLFEGMLAHDLFATFFRGFFILSTIVVIIMTVFGREVIYLKRGEYHSILLSVCIGMCLVASAQDMLMIYLALELMSIGSYILAGFCRKVGRSEEAALKYVLYGGVSTGVMLFGLTYLYGLTGSTSFIAIQSALANTNGNIDAISYVIFILVMVGVGYKIAAVPFHFWAPDVYEGSPTPITAFLSVASKGAGFALLIRLFYSTFFQLDANGVWQAVGGIDIDWGFHIALLSAVTMTVGNFGAIVQTNLKRFLAYSGIAHAGYLLMGICVLTLTGVEAVIFYLVVYLFTNLVAFLVVVIMVNAQDDERIQGLRGLWARAPWVAIFMAISFFSLIGLPPFAGFAGKYYLFIAVLEQKVYWLAIVAGLNTVVSLYYYARVIKAMFFEDPSTEEVINVPYAFSGLLIVLSIPILVFGIWWNPLVRYAEMCAKLLQG